MRLEVRLNLLPNQITFRYTSPTHIMPMMSESGKNIAMTIPQLQFDAFSPILFANIDCSCCRQLLMRVKSCSWYCNLWWCFCRFVSSCSSWYSCTTSSCRNCLRWRSSSCSCRFVWSILFADAQSSTALCWLLFLIFDEFSASNKSKMKH